MSGSANDLPVLSRKGKLNSCEDGAIISLLLLLCLRVLCLSLFVLKRNVPFCFLNITSVDRRTGRVLNVNPTKFEPLYRVLNESMSRLTFSIAISFLNHTLFPHDVKDSKYWARDLKVLLFGLRFREHIHI